MTLIVIFAAAVFGVFFAACVLSASKPRSAGAPTHREEKTTYLLTVRQYVGSRSAVVRLTETERERAEQVLQRLIKDKVRKVSFRVGGIGFFNMDSVVDYSFDTLYEDFPK